MHGGPESLQQLGIIRLFPTLHVPIDRDYLADLWTYSIAQVDRSAVEHQAHGLGKKSGKLFWLR